MVLFGFYGFARIIRFNANSGIVAQTATELIEQDKQKNGAYGKA